MDVIQYRAPPEFNGIRNSALQPHRESVKFKSDMNLYTQSKDEIVTQTPIVASTSSDSLMTANKESKPKHKRSWKKLLLPANDRDKDKEPVSDNNKSKYKKFFSRHSKKAVPS